MDGEMNKNQTIRADSEYESEDYDIADANCELAMVDGQLCSIPYDIYDLPSLTKIMSVETWNSFLTDEDRHFLSHFLPDMDQQTFDSTIQELFGGARLYFGNPMDIFFNKLRGGLCTPKIACCKDCLVYAKRKRYYYTLRFYHEKMINTFTAMGRLWDKYGNELDNNSRLILWSQRKKNGNLKMLDLNIVPSEKMDGATCRPTTPYVVKPVERNILKNLTFPHSGGTKNTFKVKVFKKGIFQHYQGSSPVSFDHHHQTVPKGLLRVSPKPPYAFLRETYGEPGHNLLPIRATGSSTLFPSSPYPGTRFRKPHGTICSITQLPECLLNHQDTSLTRLETTKSSINKLTVGKEPFYDPTDSICRGLGASNHSITEQVHYHLKSPLSVKPGILNTGSGTTETNRVSARKNFQTDATLLQKPLRVLSEDNHVRETNDDHLCSSAYKRRKI